MGGWIMDSGRDEREWRQSVMMLARLAACAISRQGTLAHANVPLSRIATPLPLSCFQNCNIMFSKFHVYYLQTRI